MRDDEDMKYMKLGITGTAVAVAGILFAFLLRGLPVFGVFLEKILAILMPFIYGGVIAYLLAPGCNAVEKAINRLLERAGKKGGRVAAALSIPICLLLAFLVLLALSMMVVPRVCQSVFELGQALPKQISSAGRWLSDLLENQPELQAYIESLFGEMQRRLQSWLQSDLIPTAQNVLNSVSGQMAGLFSTVANLFFGVLVSIYLLAGRRKFGAQSRMLLHGFCPPRVADWIEYEVDYADKVFSGFLMGKLLDSAIIGLICFAGTSLMGIHSSILVSAIVGVTNIIPFFGPYLGAVPCILLLLFENPLHSLYFTIFIVILQQVDGNLIGPKILGDKTGLSGFWVLFSILLFGGLWGFVGMIIGVPFFAVLYDIVRRMIFRGLARKGKSHMIQDYHTSFAREEEKESTQKKK